MSFRRLIWFFSVSFSFIGGGWHLKVTGLSPMTRDDHFRFGSVFIKKSNQTEFKKKNRNRFKLIGFGLVFSDKNRFGSVFLVWLSFSRFDSVFSVFCRFGFFRFQAYKTRTERVGFFQNFNRFNRFFFTIRFFRLFFSGFLYLNGFSVFLLTPTNDPFFFHSFLSPTLENKLQMLLLLVFQIQSFQFWFLSFSFLLKFYLFSI